MTLVARETDLISTQKSVGGLDFGSLGLKLLASLVPDTLLGNLSALAEHERRVAVAVHVSIQPDLSFYQKKAGGNSLGGVEILHNLAMALRSSRSAIDQSGSTELGISSREVGDQPRDQHLFAGVRQRGPGRSRIGAVDGNVFPRGGDAGGELTGEVQEETLGSAILMALSEAVLVVAHLLEVGACLWQAHGGCGRVETEGSDES